MVLLRYERIETDACPRQCCNFAHHHSLLKKEQLTQLRSVEKKYVLTAEAVGWLKCSGSILQFVGGRRSKVDPAPLLMNNNYYNLTGCRINASPC